MKVQSQIEEEEAVDTLIQILDTDLEEEKKASVRTEENDDSEEENQSLSDTSDPETSQFALKTQRNLPKRIGYILL